MALALRVKGGSPSAFWASEEKVIPCPLLCTTMVWDLSEAPSRLPVPGCVVVITALPAPVMVTTLPFTRATSGLELVKLKARPLQAEATISKGGSPKVRSGIAGKVISWHDLRTLRVPFTGTKV